MNGFFLRSRLIVLLKKLEAEGQDAEGQESEPANAEQIAGQDPQNAARWMATMAENIRRMESVAHEQGLPMIYVGRAERDAERYRDEKVERLNGPIRDRKHFVDVAELLSTEAAEYSSDKLFKDWTHYTPRGHRFVAEELCRQLRPDGEIFEQIMTRKEGGARR